MSDFEDVQKLIRLKRHERPPDDYFDDFLMEFQRRQRSELLNRSARSLFFERVATYFSGFGKPGWVYGAGAAYAVAMLVFFAIPRNQEQAKAPASPEQVNMISPLLTEDPVQLVPTPSLRDGREAASSRYYPVDRSKVSPLLSEDGFNLLDKESEKEPLKDIEWF